MSSHAGLQQSLPPVGVAGDYNYQSGPSFKKRDEMLTGKFRSLCAAVKINKNNSLDGFFFPFGCSYK